MRKLTLYRSWETEFADFPKQVQFELTPELEKIITDAQAILSQPDCPYSKIVTYACYDITDEPLRDYGINSEISIHSHTWWLDVRGKFDSGIQGEYSPDKPDDEDED